MTPPFFTLSLETQRRCELVNITDRLTQALIDSKVQEGVMVAQVLHTTAGLTINENADPDVVADLLGRLEQLAPYHGKYLHSEGNSDAHIKASLVGASVTLPVSQGRLVLGTWQGVFFCEFDGPRPRQVVAKVLGS